MCSQNKSLQVSVASAVEQIRLEKKALLHRAGRPARIRAVVPTIAPLSKMTGRLSKTLELIALPEINYGKASEDFREQKGYEYEAPTPSQLSS